MKERVRILLERYGIVFRELLERESPLFRWGKIFRALRLMELSGEVLAGYFFRDIPGPQFMTARVFQILQGKLPEKVYWLNATDAASLCGVQVEAIKGELPKRLAGNHVVYHGTRVVVTSQRNGRMLVFHVPPDAPHLPEYLVFLRHLLDRQFQPLHRIIIDTINGDAAAGESLSGGAPGQLQRHG
jgi:ATP-dependent Lhr-like helicase